MLEINKGASGSLHYQPEKKETLIVATGRIELEYGNQRLKMTAGPKAITILPGIPHRFTAIKPSTIMEISTHHDDQDVVRIEESRG